MHGFFHGYTLKGAVQKSSRHSPCVRHQESHTVTVGYAGGHRLKTGESEGVLGPIIHPVAPR